MWQRHKFKALFPAASGSRSPGIDNSNWILKTAAQESRTTALGGTRHSPACLPSSLLHHHLLHHLHSHLHLQATPLQTWAQKTSKIRSPFASCCCCLHCVIQNAPEISLAAVQKPKKKYIYIKLEKKAAAVFSVHAHSNVLNKKAGREKARERTIA